MLLRAPAIPLPVRTALILAAAVLALLLPMIWRGEVLAGGDLINQYIPYKTLWAEELRAGRLPLWNPHTFGGRPHLADVQLGTFYPPNWLLLVMPLAAGFTLLAALHLWWGGLGMAAFLRRLGLDEIPALMGGLLFALGGYQTSRLFPGIVFFIFAASWLPWALAALWAIETGRAKRGAIALAFILTMQLFTGAPQVLYFTLLFVGLVFALRVVMELWAGREARYANDDYTTGAASWLPGSRQWAAALAAAALFLIMGSPQWPATLEFSAHTIERAEGASYQYSADGSVAPRYVLLNIVPEIFGPLGNEEIYWGGPEGFWEISCWMGVVAPGLALLALVLLIAHWRRAGRESFDTYMWRIQSAPAAEASDQSALQFTSAHRLFLAAIVIAWGAGWLLALGQNSPVYLVAYYVLPFLNKFRVPGRFLIFHFLAVAVLAPLAIQVVLARKDAATLHWERRLAIAALSILAAGYLLIGAVLNPMLNLLGIQTALPFAPLYDRLRELALHSWILAAIVLIPALALVAWVILRARHRVHITSAVVVLCAIELLTYGWGAAQSKRPRDIAAKDYARSEVVEILERRNQDGRFLCLDSVYAWQHDQNQMELYPNRPMMHGLFDARGYDPLYLAPYAHVMSLTTGLPPTGSKGAFLFMPTVAYPALASMLNIRTILSYDAMTAPFEQVAAIRFDDGKRLLVYDNPGAMGWAWLAGVDERPAAPLLNIMAATPERVATRALLEAEDWDWLRQAASPAQWEAMRGAMNPAERGAIEITARRPGRYEIRADVSAPSLLVVAENIYPGWRAMVNGEPVQILRVNHTLIGVPLPAGQHTITMQYVNSRIMLSLVAALATALLALVILRSRHFEPTDQYS